MCHHSLEYCSGLLYAMDRRGAFQSGFGSGSTGSFDSHASVDHSERWPRYLSQTTFQSERNTQVAIICKP